ncbi:MAG: hypothetical protein ACI92Z_000955 [Paracoccaceae bacterium]|jgi:hypothetical protein
MARSCSAVACARRSLVTLFNRFACSSVRYQWLDASSFEDAFRDVEADYLVTPTDTFDSISAMQPAFEYARNGAIFVNWLARADNSPSPGN